MEKDAFVHIYSFHISKGFFSKWRERPFWIFVENLPGLLRGT